MDGTNLLELIRDVGAPFAVLLIVLLRLEPRLDQQTRAIDRLTDAVWQHAGRRRVRASRLGPGGSQP